MKFKFSILTSFAILMLASSCSMFHDDLDPCKQPVYFNLRYTKNLQGKDQFAEKVHCAQVLIYDADGNFVGKYDYDMTDHLSLMLPPGDYHAIAYGGVACDASDVMFNLPLDQDHHYSFLESYIAGTRAPEVSKDLHDYYHAMGDFTVKSQDYGEVYHTLDLTKNTNRFRVEVMYTDGRRINSSNFKVYLTADNAVTDHANKVVPQGEDVIYRYNQRGSEESDEVIGDTKAWKAWFNIATGRIVPDSNIRLHIERAAWKEVFVNKSLIEYLDEVRKKEKPDMTLEQYLDCQDQWTLTFIVEPDNDQFTIVSLKINEWNIIANGFDF